jgi:hypothetical protein
MKSTGHKMEAVYWRYTIDCEADLNEGLKKLMALEGSLKGTPQPRANATDFSHSVPQFPPQYWSYAANYGGGASL